MQGDAEAKSKIQSVGGAFQNFGKQADVVNQQTEKIGPNMKQAALGLSAAAASGVALAFQFDNLQKSAVRVEQAEKNLQIAEARSIDSKRTLQKLVADGKTGTDEYQSAVLRAGAAEDQLSIATQKVNIAQGDQTQAMVGFALNVIPSTIGMVSSVSMAISGMGGSMGFMAAMSGIASGALGVLRTALTFIAMHPIILPLTALATVLTLIATNAFGLRDAIDAFAKKVEEVFPWLKPVFDFFRMIAATIFPDTQKATEDLGSEMETRMTQIQVATGAAAMSVETNVKRMKTAVDSIGAPSGGIADYKPYTPPKDKRSFAEMLTASKLSGELSKLYANTNTTAVDAAWAQYNAPATPAQTERLEVKIYMDGDEIAAKVVKHVDVNVRN